MNKTEHKQQVDLLKRRCGMVLNGLTFGHADTKAQVAEQFGAGRTPKEYKKLVSDHYALLIKQLPTPVKGVRKPKHSPFKRVLPSPVAAKDNAEAAEQDEAADTAGVGQQGESSTAGNDNAEEVEGGDKRVRKIDPIFPYAGKSPILQLKLFQQRWANFTVEQFTKRDAKSVILSSGTGTGKTIIAGDILAQLNASGFFETKGWPAYYKCVVVTRNTVVEQFTIELETKFGLSKHDDFLVLNYEKLRTTFGERFVYTENVVDNEGEINTEWRWRPYMAPPLVIWDECHALKNEKSTQHKIALAMQDLPRAMKPWQIFMSATVATRVCDLKVPAIACELDVE